LTDVTAIMSEKTRRAYRIWAASYDSARNPQLVLDHAAVLELVDARRRDTILVAACGTGRFITELGKSGAEVVGLDFCDEMLAIAAEKCPGVRFVRSDLLRRLPFPGASFNKIVLPQAADHLPRLKYTIREFARVLKPRGMIVLSVSHPDMNWIGYERRDDASGRFKLREHADVHCHRFCDYFEAIQAAGLDADRIVQLPVSGQIRHLLTPRSYRVVRGRYQVLVLRLRKPLAELRRYRSRP
jgi:SAM-dependent methyltransferase